MSSDLYVSHWATWGRHIPGQLTSAAAEPGNKGLRTAAAEVGGPTPGQEEEVPRQRAGEPGDHRAGSL